MLYMQEVEKMEGYGQENYPAKVCLQYPFVVPHSSKSNDIQLAG